MRSLTNTVVLLAAFACVNRADCAGPGAAIDSRQSKIANPLAYWRFDEGGGRIVRNAARAAGGAAIHGKANWIRHAEGFALDFNGVDAFVDCGKMPELDFGTSDFSIVVALSLRGPCKANGILTKTDSLGSASGWKLSTSSRGFRLRIGDGKAYRNVFARMPNPDGWQHVAVVRRGDDLEFYCNGARQGTANGVGKIDINSAAFPVRIGHKAGYQFLDGLVDDIRVYRRALDATAIQAQYRVFVVGTRFLDVPLSQTMGRLRLRVAPRIAAAPRARLDVLCRNLTTLAERTFSSDPGAARSGRWDIHCPEYLTPGAYHVEVRVVHDGRVADTEWKVVRIHRDVLTEQDLPEGEPHVADGVLFTQLAESFAGDGKPFSYRARNGASGVGLELGFEQAIMLRAKLPGNYAVYVGLNNPCPRVLLKFGPDPRRYSASETPDAGAGNVKEVFAGVGCFEKGDSLLIQSLAQSPLRVYCVRMIRLTDEELALERHGNEPVHNQRVIYNNDGYSDFFGARELWSKEQLCWLVDRYRSTDVEIFEFTALVSGAVNFSSRYATYFGAGHLEGEVWANRDAMLAARFYRQMDRAGLPVFKTLIQRAHEIGLPIHGSLRMSGYYGPSLANDSGYIPLNGDLSHEHPEWRIRYRKGTRGYRMSYAWEAVREQRMGVLSEMVEMGCDGVCLDFCRYPYVLGYDDPLVRGFEEAHGIDPRKLPENDERWLAYRCRFLNGFFRETRRRMNALGAKRARPVSITIRVPATGYRAYGFDPQTWIKEGLVDILVPHYPGLEKDFDVRPWVEMVKGTEVRIYPGMTATKSQTARTELTDAEIKAGVKPGKVITMSADDYRRKAAKRYRLGAHGAYIFNNWGGRACLNQLGDRRSLERWSHFEDPMSQVELTATLEDSAASSVNAYVAKRDAAIPAIRQALSDIQARDRATYRLNLSLENGAVLSGAVAIVAEPVGFVPLRVDFHIDGKKVSTERASPYWCFGDFAKWNTTTVPNGNHRITAVAARPDSGLTHRTVTVAVNN